MGQTVDEKGHWAYPARHDLDRFVATLSMDRQKELKDLLDKLESQAWNDGWVMTAKHL